MEFTAEDHRSVKERATAQFKEAIELKKKFLEQDQIDTLVLMAATIVGCLARGGKLMLCGNGGSAADAQHLAAELLVRLRSHTNREGIPAISLALDPSTITACANDYGFEHLYGRMVQALGKKEDVLLGLTTSGRSKNVILALQQARKKGITTLGFLGGDGGQTTEECDRALIVPSTDPNRVQEIHITAGHILMDLIEYLMIQRNLVQKI